MVTAMGQTSSTTLHQAIQNANTKQLEQILRRKTRPVDVNEKTNEKTALFMAVMQEDELAVDLLLQHGANVNIICQVEKNSWAFEWSVIHESCW